MYAVQACTVGTAHVSMPTLSKNFFVLVRPLAVMIPHQKESRVGIPLMRHDTQDDCSVATVEPNSPPRDACRLLHSYEVLRLSTIGYSG